MVGVQGLQGIGKTTLCQELSKLFHQKSIVCVTLSLDDFYLPDAEQTHDHEDPRFRGRGNPGTHDVDLLGSCMDRLINFKEPVTLPIYNRAAHGGRGDRTSFVRCVSRRPDVILLEGWCVGFRPLPEHSHDDVNRHLAAYAQVFGRLDTLVSLQGSPEWCVAWRQESEPEGGMTAEQVGAFTKRFLITFGVYAPHLHPNVIVKIDRNRNVVSVTESCAG